MAAVAAVVLAVSSTALKRSKACLTLEPTVNSTRSRTRKDTVTYSASWGCCILGSSVHVALELHLSKDGVMLVRF